MDLFAWSATDIPEINLEVMFHYLKMNPTYHSIKQKKQNFILEHQKAITEELDKLIKVSFIGEVMYPDWLANIMRVKKANEK